jgi:hypothetical protein
MRKGNSASCNAKCETEEQCSSVDYHLPVGEEGNIWDGLEGLRHAVEVGAAAVAHVGVEHGLGDILGVVLVRPVELVLQVVDAVLLLIPRDTRAPLEALEAGFALRAVLRALAALVLVAVPADGEGALVAGDEGLAVGVEPHVVAANLAHLPVLLVHRLRPWLAIAADDDELVPVVRAGDQPGAGLHPPRPTRSPDLRRLLLWLPRRPSEGGARAAAAAGGNGGGERNAEEGEESVGKGERRRACLGLLSFVALRAALLPVW